MSEEEFSRIQGNSFRGSRYGNFAGGGITPQGNVSSAATENNITKVGTSGEVAQDAPPTPTNASKGLTADMGEATVKAPSTTDMAVGIGLPFAGQAVGQAAGASIGAGSTFGEGISRGFSSLANTASGGLIGTASNPTNIALGNMGSQFGPATPAAVDAASKASNVSSANSGASIGGAAGAGLATAAAVLLTGGGVEKAAKSGIGTAAGTYIGTAVAGPIGGFVGGAIGGMVGGRVICTQLVKDGLLSPEDQYLDMQFTFEALSNIHVRGYLFWARGWVKKMRKNKTVRDMTLKIVVWRLNEIKYQLKMRDKPDWRGKIVRHVMENFCLVVGLFVPDTEESAIYKKESSHVSA